MKQKNIEEKNISKKKLLLLDWLFCVFIAIVLILSNDYIDITFLKLFGHLSLLGLSFTLFIDLFPEKYKKRKIIIFLAIIFITIFILIMSVASTSQPFKDYDIFKFIDDLSTSITFISIVFDFAEKDRMYRLYEKIRNIF